MEGKKNDLQKPIDIKENNKNGDPCRQEPGKKHHQNKRAPRQNPRDDFKKTFHDEIEYKIQNLEYKNSGF
jgi:hypothetical protein